MDQPGKAANPARGQLNREKNIPREYVVRFFCPGGVFLPCDHRLDFLHQLI